MQSKAFTVSIQQIRFALGFLFRPFTLALQYSLSILRALSQRKTRIFFENL